MASMKRFWNKPFAMLKKKPLGEGIKTWNTFKNNTGKSG